MKRTILTLEEKARMEGEDQGIKPLPQEDMASTEAWRSEVDEKPPFTKFSYYRDAEEVADRKDILLGDDSEDT